MEPTILTYLGFFVAVIIIVWAALEFRSRLWRMTDREERRRNVWVKLDTKKGPPTPEEPLTVPESEQDEEREEQPDRNLHMRARQNGHHTETKYPL